MLFLAKMALNFFRKKSMRGEKATAGTSFLAGQSPADLVRLVIRFFQFIMGIVIIGLYAQDLVKAQKAGVGRDPKWMFATLTGAIASIWALLTVWLKSWFFFLGDFLVFLLYLVNFGMFGKMYINEDPEGNKGIVRMKRAVWIHLTNMFLWLITAIWGASVFVKERRARTTHTGQASMHV